MIITPQEIEKAAKDIVGFWEESDLPEADKHKILSMVKDYYTDENNHIFQQYFAQLCERTIDRRVPKTDFERND